MSKPGVAVIFNFIDFDIHNLNKRTTSLFDVKRLQKAFYGMNLAVCTVNNPSLEVLNNEIHKLSKFDFTMYASIQIVFMSHGSTRNILFCKDGQFDFTEKCEKIFVNSTLQKKAKYVIVQGCRGSCDTDWIYNQDDPATPGDGIFQPNAILFSSFESFISYLGPDGSAFIESFCKVLAEKWKTDKYLKILEEVIVEFNNSPNSAQQTATMRLIPYLNDDNFSFGSFPGEHTSFEKEFM